jgi:alanine racemase
MKILDFLRSVKKSLSNYQPAVEVLISKNNLLHNLEQYREQYPDLLFAPVLKSNAYGHGLVPIAQILDKEKIAFLVVDSLYEAMILRSAGIRSHILVIGYTSVENIQSCTIANTAFTITSLEQLRSIAKTLRAPKDFHIKIDTGMHRQGILPSQIRDAISIIKACPLFTPEGICSHFADADSEDDSFTKIQITCWEESIRIFKESFQSIRFFHIAATAGTFYSPQTYGNVARLGIGLYGFNPSPQGKLHLKPVLQMQSIIGSVKTVSVGERIGYNLTYTLEKDTVIATVPVGYFEGVDRRLSNCGGFTREGQYCPILGRVSMNITSIDISSFPQAKIGDKVTVISNNKENKNSIENIAKIAQTIPYEILVHIPQHLRRIIVP